MGEAPREPTLNELTAEILEKDLIEDEDSARLAAALHLGLTKGDCIEVDEHGNEVLTSS